MAGLLLVGSDVGLVAYSLVRSRAKSPENLETALARKDLPWLAGAIAAAVSSALCC